MAADLSTIRDIAGRVAKAYGIEVVDVELRGGGGDERAQDGVETVIAILRRELQAIMAQTGAASIAQIRRDSLVPRA